MNHLLFASVELLPTEMPAPPNPPRGGWWSNIGDDRLCVGRTALPLADALDWYEALKQGRATIPGKTFAITASALGPEPDYEGFAVLPEPPPFSPSWHGRPRLHRLVPMAALAEPVQALRDRMVNVSAEGRARQWLRDHIHFDLLAYDDWLGSGVLIAPNPLLRGFSARIVNRSVTPETLELGGTPRRGANVTSLRMVVEEVRAGAPAWRAEGSPNALGRFRARAPSQVAMVREELFCPVRGVLDREPPAFFFRDFSVSSSVVAEAKARYVDPPTRAPDAGARTVYVRPAPARQSAPPMTPLRALEYLQDARAERQGALRPAESPQVPPGVRLFEHNRGETVDWICGLIGRARSHVLFVDPYLDADDLQQFATATQYQGVAIRGLINPRPRRHKLLDPNGDSFGDLMLKKIAAFRDPAQEFGEIDIRVSLGRRLHDRFLQIDDVIWHAGHSFNKVGGGEISLMTLVAQPIELAQALGETFAEAEPFETWWANRPPAIWSWRHEAGHQLRRLAKWIERPPAGQVRGDVDD
ncbi:VPA1262 family N-terminal domain-containing protein [Rhizobium tumorigenes]|uniref:VPA1262 family N-terminal domain-containing protein n=1 Tax=Rhizobium tumorigenes TaxID=2041385 RepID=A0AAF1KWU9_9HYPH|nr:VPA1262 family N-terminal domain-containing protein [Rhizobium tumorigenes]WFR98049.1 VPA1262 family N-terminal domain-containing protein [Rhizobium tumorigenes]